LADGEGGRIGSAPDRGGANRYSRLSMSDSRPRKLQRGGGSGQLALSLFLRDRAARPACPRTAQNRQTLANLAGRAAAGAYGPYGRGRIGRHKPNSRPDPRYVNEPIDQRSTRLEIGR
jgi:hypothetical protein